MKDGMMAASSWHDLVGAVSYFSVVLSFAMLWIYGRRWWRYGPGNAPDPLTSLQALLVGAYGLILFCYAFLPPEFSQTNASWWTRAPRLLLATVLIIHAVSDALIRTMAEESAGSAANTAPEPPPKSPASEIEELNAEIVRLMARKAELERRPDAARL